MQAGGHLHIFKMRFFHTKSGSGSLKGRCTKSLWRISQLTAACKCPQRTTLGRSGYPGPPRASQGLNRAVYQHRGSTITSLLPAVSTAMAQFNVLPTSFPTKDATFSHGNSQNFEPKWGKGACHCSQPLKYQIPDKKKFKSYTWVGCMSLWLLYAGGWRRWLARL